MIAIGIQLRPEGETCRSLPAVGEGQQAASVEGPLYVVIWMIIRPGWTMFEQRRDGHAEQEGGTEPGRTQVLLWLFLDGAAAWTGEPIMVAR